MLRQALPDIVSHVLHPISAEFPELRSGPRAWSLLDKVTYSTPVVSDVELFSEPVVHHAEHFHCATINGLSLDSSALDMPPTDPDGIMADIIKGARMTTYKTQGNRNFIQCVNTTCPDLICSFDDHVTEILHASNVSNVIPAIEDLFVLFQETLVWKQGPQRSNVTEFDVPIFQPFGGSLDDFSSSTYQERSSVRVLGNTGADYTKWAEINLGDPLFIFSCLSIDGWFTYVYTGITVRCIGRTKFSGVCFGHDEVIYSLKDVQSLVMLDQRRPVVNVNWRPYPITDATKLTRIVCRSSTGDDVFVHSVLKSDSPWISQCTIEELSQMYNKNFLAPDVAHHIDALITYHMSVGVPEYDLIEIAQCYSPPKIEMEKMVPVVPYTRGRRHGMSRVQKENVFDPRSTMSRNGELFCGELVVNSPKCSYKLGSVNFAVCSNKVRIAVIDSGVDMTRLSDEERFEQTIVELRRANHGFTSPYLDWEYRVRVGSNIFEGRNDLQISIQEISFTNRLVLLKTRFLKKYNLPGLMLRTGTTYRSIALSILQ